MSRIGKSIEAESRLAGASAWGWGLRLILEVMKMGIIMMIVAQLCENTKTH
jgi:hypothetical protein